MCPQLLPEQSFAYLSSFECLESVLLFLIAELGVGLWSNPLSLLFWPRRSRQMAQSRSLLVVVISSLSRVYALPPFTLWLISLTVVKWLVAGLHGGYIASSYHYHGWHKMLQVSFYFYCWRCTRAPMPNDWYPLGVATQDEVLYYSWELASIHGVSGAYMHFQTQYTTSVVTRAYMFFEKECRPPQGVAEKCCLGSSLFDSCHSVRIVPLSKPNPLLTLTH